MIIPDIIKKKLNQVIKKGNKTLDNEWFISNDGKLNKWLFNNCLVCPTEYNTWEETNLIIAIVKPTGTTGAWLIK